MEENSNTMNESLKNMGNRNSPRIIRLNGNYTKSRHTFTMSDEVYREWEEFVAPYNEKGALINAALMFFILLKEKKSIEIVDPSRSEGIDMNTINKYLGF